jgi:uncharacterized membrane protein YbhN (UPF0104 family)
MRNDATQKDSSWSWRIRLIGTVLSLALLVWLLRQQNWDEILNTVKTLTPEIILLSYGLFLTRYIWHTARWLILVRAQDIPLTYTRGLQLVFSGLFISNFLPGMVGGDVVRIAGVVQDSDKRIAGAASVIVDRIVGVFGMLFVLPFSIPLVSSLISTGVILGGQVSAERSSVVEVLRDSFQRSKRTLSMWLRQPIQLFLALAASWMGILSYLASIWVLVQGLDIQVSILDIAGVSALTYFLTIIPLSINGYGIREVAVVGLYAQAGATVEQATALALLSRALFLMASLPGVIWVGRILKKVRSEAIDPGDGE